MIALAPDYEVEAIEEEILDQVTAARTIGELKAKVTTLERLQALADSVRNAPHSLSEGDASNDSDFLLK